MSGLGLAQPTEEPLLRPNQVADDQSEVARIDAMLAQPPSVLHNVDVQAALKHKRDLQIKLNKLSPRPYDEGERDSAVAEEAQLRDAISQGMCTQEEMRRKPAGAVSKHMAWEKRNKKNILRWKNMRLRMHATGMLPDHASDAPSDIANIETFRPSGGPGELNLDNCQIPGARYYFPGQIEPGNVADGDAKARWDQETAEILAACAAKGDGKARAALVRLTTPTVADELIAQSRKNVGTPPEIIASKAPKKE